MAVGENAPFIRHHLPAQVDAADAAVEKSDLRLVSLVPVDSIPLCPSQKQAAPFYPAYPADGFKTVSAFRQFNPNKEFETAAAAQKPDAAYEWE